METVRCNNCEWSGFEEQLIPFEEDGKFGDGYGGYGCPTCKTDEYLMDISEKDNKCKACGAPYIDHLGIEGTCRQLQEARAKIAKLEKRLSLIRACAKEGKK